MFESYKNATESLRSQMRNDFRDMCEYHTTTKSDEDYGALLKFKHKKSGKFFRIGVEKHNVDGRPIYYLERQKAWKCRYEKIGYFETKFDAQMFILDPRCPK